MTRSPDLLRRGSPGTRYPYCQVLRDLGNTASVPELHARRDCHGWRSATAGPARCCLAEPGLPAVCWDPALVVSFRPLSRSKGKHGRPIDQAAPICHDGLERIGPPAGDLCPATACPAGSAPATRAEANPGMASRTAHRRRRGSALPVPSAPRRPARRSPAARRRITAAQPTAAPAGHPGPHRRWLPS